LNEREQSEEQLKRERDEWEKKCLSLSCEHQSQVAAVHSLHRQLATHAAALGRRYAAAGDSPSTGKNDVEMPPEQILQSASSFVQSLARDYLELHANAERADQLLQSRAHRQKELENELERMRVYCEEVAAQWEERDDGHNMRSLFPTTPFSPFDRREARTAITTRELAIQTEEQQHAPTTTPAFSIASPALLTPAASNDVEDTPIDQASLAALEDRLRQLDAELLHSQQAVEERELVIADLERSLKAEAHDAVVAREDLAWSRQEVGRGGGLRVCFFYP
jgi:hypothetical protein